MITHILITGSSSGIGQELAKIFLKNNVVICGRDETKLKNTYNYSNNKSNLIWSYDFSNIDNLSKDLSTFLKDNKIYIKSFVHCAAW